MIIEILENPKYPEYPWLDPGKESILCVYEFTEKANIMYMGTHLKGPVPIDVVRQQVKERAEMMLPPELRNRAAFFERAATPEVNGCMGFVYIPNTSCCDSHV